MIYAMSDIHGEEKSFFALLEKINFSDKDKLIVTGDVVDRGPKPISTLSYIRSQKNMISLKGNHEIMTLEALKGLTKEDFDSYPEFAGVGPEKRQYLEFWIRHGGGTTLRELCAMNERERADIISYMDSLPLYKIIDMGGGKTAILVHAGLGGYHKDKLMGEYTADELTSIRPFLYQKYYDDSVTVIAGHTPTLLISGQPRIYTSENMKFIDCGATFGGALACLRLDDMAEFYVE